MRRKIIAIDIDDVLSASAEGFADFSNTRWGGGLKAEDYVEEWATFWKVPLEEAFNRSEEYYNSDAVVHYRHFDNDFPVLRRLVIIYTLVVITSRRIVLKVHTDQWLESHFPGIFKGIHYAGIWDSKHHVDHKLKQTKAEIIREIGVEYLIDDQLKHCIGAVEAGIQSLLFGDYHGITPRTFLRELRGYMIGMK